MTQIDFLPARYHERTVQRKTHVWRLLVLVIFAALVGLAAVGQLAVRRQTEAQLAAVGKQHDEVMAVNTGLADLQRQLRAARADAELYTYLRHPWPRSQILALVAEALPENVTLTKSIVHQGEATLQQLPTGNLQGPEQEAKAAAEAAKPPAERDLRRLREAFDAEAVSVTLEGNSPDEASLHEYIGKLARADLFSNVELRSVERARDEQLAGFGFNIRLTVRPGYGQPDGPKPPARPAAAEVVQVQP